MIVRKEQAVKYLSQYTDVVYLTIGFRYRNPTTKDKVLTPYEATKFVENNSYIWELDRRNGRLHLNAYTANDMY